MQTNFSNHVRSRNRTARWELLFVGKVEKDQSMVYLKIYRKEFNLNKLKIHRFQNVYEIKEISLHYDE